MTHLTQKHHNSDKANVNYQNHQDTYGFLEQIAITDSKKQKNFFARHKLNFKNQSLLKKEKKKAHNISKGIFAIGLVIMMGIIFSSYHNVKKTTIMMDLDKIDLSISDYAPVVGRDYSMDNKAEQKKIALELRYLIANPIVDVKGHLYVDNTLIASLLKNFYSISESNNYLDYEEYFNLLDDIDSPFIDASIKKEFAYKGMRAMRVHYKTAILSRDYYLSHLSKWDFRGRASNQAYQDQFDEDYFTYRESFFKFFVKQTSGVEYTLEDSNQEEKSFWNFVR